MSTQPTSLMLGQRLQALQGEPVTSDLQQVVGKVIVILSHRRWLFVIPLLTGTLMTLAASLTLPREYRLRTIFERRDDVPITHLISSSSPYSFETLRRSLWLNILGYKALDTAIENLGLTEDFPRDASGALTEEGQAKKNKLIASLSGSLTVNLLEKSENLDLIEISYTGDNPRLGREVVSQLKDNYIATTLEQIAGILYKSRDFFEEHAQTRREKVARMQAELLDISAKHPGVNPSAPQALDQKRLINEQTRENLAMRRDEAKEKLDNFVAYLEDLDRRAATAAENGEEPSMVGTAGLGNQIPNPRHTKLTKQIDEVKATIADAKSLRRMTDEHPYVSGLRAKLEQLRNELSQTPRTVNRPAEETTVAASPENPGPPVLKPWEAERRRVEAEIETLRGSLANFDKRLAELTEERDFLEQEQAMLFERRQDFLMRNQALQNARSDLQIWVSHVDSVNRVITAEEDNRGIGFATVEEARLPSRPVSPTIKGIFMLTAGVGIALGAAAVFLREVFDRSFRDPTKVRQSLGIPVLETIGEIPGSRRPGLLNRPMLMPAIATLETLLVIGTGTLVLMSLNQPKTYDRIVATLLPKGVLTMWMSQLGW